MMRYSQVGVAIITLLTFFVSPAAGTAIYDLPGFISIVACFVLHPGSTECDGLTRAQLLAQPDTFIPIASPGTGGILAGGLGDQHGDLGQGDEFFVLFLTPTGGSRFLLDSVVLIFDATQPVRFEFASAITATTSVTFAMGFGPGDLPRALGPTDGNYVEIVSGILVFAFASSAPPPGPVRVTIDIKPGSFPNSINLGSRGTVPIAILSTAAFDATTVDPTTVTLASAGVKLKGQGMPMASFEDVNGDGLLDVVLHVSTEALQLTDSDTNAVLEGRTFDGTRITGTDSVRIVP